MTALRDTLERLGRASALPALASDRLTELEKAAARLITSTRSNSGSDGGDESWDAVARRVDPADLAAAVPRDIRRALNEVWRDSGREMLAEPLVQFSLDEHRKTFDRELVLAYLRHFPATHRSFSMLTGAAGTAAERHDWPWRERGRRYQLWNELNGPAALGGALLGGDDPMAVLRDVGLDGDLASGGFVKDALDEACERVGSASADEAERLGKRLISIAGELPVAGSDALLAYALLNPWRARSPSDAYRKEIGAVLVRRIGDPRFAAARWAAVLADLGTLLPGLNGSALLALLRRWLTEKAVRGFFKIVGQTTDNKQQWAARERFWLAYLDEGVITDGWFAFGRRAELIAGKLARDEDLAFGRVVGGADPSHSALILTIGDLRIAEWSHNGSCRFWPRLGQVAADDYWAERYPAPVPYLEEYDGTLLRTTVGPGDFAYLSHNSGWEQKFAGRIFRETGVMHRDHGRGREW